MKRSASDQQFDPSNLSVVDQPAETNQSSPTDSFTSPTNQPPQLSGDTVPPTLYPMQTPTNTGNPMPMFNPIDPSPTGTTNAASNQYPSYDAWKQAQGTQPAQQPAAPPQPQSPIVNPSTSPLSPPSFPAQNQNSNSVRPTGSQPGNDAWLQNLATFMGGDLWNPGGNLRFNPMSGDPFMSMPVISNLMAAQMQSLLRQGMGNLVMSGAISPDAFNPAGQQPGAPQPGGMTNPQSPVAGQSYEQWKAGQGQPPAANPSPAQPSQPTTQAQPQAAPSVPMPSWYDPSAPQSSPTPQQPQSAPQGGYQVGSSMLPAAGNDPNLPWWADGAQNTTTNAMFNPNTTPQQQALGLSSSGGAARGQGEVLFHSPSGDQRETVHSDQELQAILAALLQGGITPFYQGPLGGYQGGS